MHKLSVIAVSRCVHQCILWSPEQSLSRQGKLYIASVNPCFRIR
jgi:hypothetical protein